MRIDTDEFQKHCDAGYLKKQTLDDLTIWNYTHKAQYDRVWNDTTMLARGLITTPGGTIHSRSFRKFFNLGESPGPGIGELPSESPVITTKMDGYLGLTYVHGGRVKIASRGSFTSEYAQWATKWLQEVSPNAYDELNWASYTFVFEILYPYRRIVVDNSNNFGLCLLAIIHTDSGDELHREFVVHTAKLHGWPVVKYWDTHSLVACIDSAKTLNGTEQEGFVAHYPKTGIRVKIKGEDYCRIHRIATRLTKRRIWEMLSPEMPSTGGTQIHEIMEILPPEYSNWIKSEAAELLTQKNELYKRALLAVDRVWPKLARPAPGTRKYIVMALQDNFKDVWHEALYLIDGKEHLAIESIWNRIRPDHAIPVLAGGNLADGDDE